MAYEKNWESLITHETPEWYLDVKFGLYAHWGLYSVPGFGHEWYAKRMYDPKDPIHREHKEKIGPIAQTGYTQFIDQFTAEHFDAGEWADLMKRSGAGYGGFSLAHHDGFGLWDSDVYRWNVGKMGPKRDLYGEMAAALKERGMRLMAPFHIIRGFNWFLPGWNQWDQTMDEEAVALGRKEGWELFDKDKADFYWNQFTGNFDDFLRLWVLKIKEVVDKYSPDVMWFDGGKFTEKEFADAALDVLAHYLNAGEKAGKEVTVLNKLPVSMVLNFHRDFGVWQFEAGRDRPPFMGRPWSDDMKIGSGSWGYLDDQEYLSGREILAGVIDRAARGGNTVISLSPRGDGTIPQGQQDALEHVGRWLAHSGEAVHATRPWKIHAEGDEAKLRGREDDPAFFGKTVHPRWFFARADGNDIRYTRSKNGKTLYVVALGQPDGEVKLEALGRMAENLAARPGRISGLEQKTPLEFRWEEDALYLQDIPFDKVRDDKEPKAWKIEL